MAACASRAPASPSVAPPGTGTPIALPVPSPDLLPTPDADVYTFTLTIDPPGAGFVGAVPPFGPHKAGGIVILSVIPPRVHPYVFGRWGGDASGTDRAITIVMDSDKAVTAHFINPFITPSPAPEQ